jgi:flagellar motor switch/type III secretory pathway protein FliN
MNSSAVQKNEATPAEPVATVATAVTAAATAAAALAQTQDPLDSMPWLPCTLSLELPVVQFTIGDLLSLTKGSVVQTACHQTSDVPLRVNQLLIGWTEFEVVGDKLAVRITEQA